MRIFQIIAVKLLSLVAIFGGALFLVAQLRQPSADALWQYAEDHKLWLYYGLPFGLLLLAFGVMALMPLAKPKRKNSISFPGTHGDVTIQLDSVEATLGRVVSKMPEVKKISVKVTPSEDNRRAQVTADVWMHKGVEALGAREIANKIGDFLADTAMNILGVEDVTKVNLNVRGIAVGSVPPQKPEGETDTLAKTPQPEPQGLRAQKTSEEPFPSPATRSESADAAPVWSQQEYHVTAEEASFPDVDEPSSQKVKKDSGQLS